MAGEIARAEAPGQNLRVVIQPRLDLGFIEAVCRNSGGVLWPQDDHGLSRAKRIVRAQNGHGARHCRENFLGARAAVIIDVVRAFCPEYGDRTRFGVKTALDMERLPRTLRGVFRKAIGDFGRCPLGRPV